METDPKTQARDKLDHAIDEILDAHIILFKDNSHEHLTELSQIVAQLQAICYGLKS